MHQAVRLLKKNRRFNELKKIKDMNLQKLWHSLLSTKMQ